MSTDVLDDAPERNELTDLLNRFFTFARPIANACHEPGLNMCLSDPAPFRAHIEALERLGYTGIEATLLVFLDEFSQLEQRSYDELYLWSIVELSRRNVEYVETFWPLAVTLDLRFRAEPWQRPADVALVEQPYRLTELVVYHYVLATAEPDPDPDVYFAEEVYVRPKPKHPFLATCLRRILNKLSAEEQELLFQTVGELAHGPEHRSVFSDAYGSLVRVRRRPPEPET